MHLNLIGKINIISSPGNDFMLMFGVFQTLEIRNFTKSQPSLELQLSLFVSSVKKFQGTDFGNSCKFYPSIVKCSRKIVSCTSWFIIVKSFRIKYLASFEDSKLE